MKLWSSSHTPSLYIWLLILVWMFQSGSSLQSQGEESTGECGVNHLILAYQTTSNDVQLSVTSSQSNTQTVTFLNESFPDECGPSHTRCNVTVLRDENSDRLVIVLPFVRGAGLALYESVNSSLIFLDQYVLELTLAGYNCHLTRFLDGDDGVIVLCFNLTGTELSLSRVVLRIDYNNLNMSTFSPRLNNEYVPYFSDISQTVFFEAQARCLGDETDGIFAFFIDGNALIILDLGNTANYYFMFNSQGDEVDCVNPRRLVRISETVLIAYCENITIEINVCETRIETITVTVYTQQEQGVRYYCSDNLGMYVTEKDGNVTVTLPSTTISRTFQLPQDVNGIYYGDCIIQDDQLWLVITSNDGNTHLLDLSEGNSTTLGDNDDIIPHMIYSSHNILYSNVTHSYVYNLSCPLMPVVLATNTPYLLTAYIESGETYPCVCSPPNPLTTTDVVTDSTSETTTEMITETVAEGTTTQAATDLTTTEPMAIPTTFEAATTQPTTTSGDSLTTLEPFTASNGRNIIVLASVVTLFVIVASVTILVLVIIVIIVILYKCGVIKKASWVQHIFNNQRNHEAQIKLLDFQSNQPNAANGTMSTNVPNETANKTTSKVISTNATIEQDTTFTMSQPKSSNGLQMLTTPSSLDEDNKLEGTDPLQAVKIENQTDKSPSTPLQGNPRVDCDDGTTENSVVNDSTPPKTNNGECSNGRSLVDLDQNLPSTSPKLEPPQNGEYPIGIIQPHSSDNLTTFRAPQVEPNRSEERGNPSDVSSERTETKLDKNSDGTKTAATVGEITDRVLSSTDTEIATNVTADDPKIDQTISTDSDAQGSTPSLSHSNGNLLSTIPKLEPCEPEKQDNTSKRSENLIGRPQAHSDKPEEQENGSDGSNNTMSKPSQQETGFNKNLSAVHLGPQPQKLHYHSIQGTCDPEQLMIQQYSEEPDNGLNMICNNTQRTTELHSHHDSTLISGNDLQNQTTTASDHNELVGHNSDPSNEPVEIHTEGSPQDDPSVENTCTTNVHIHNGDCNIFECPFCALHRVGSETVPSQQVTERKNSETSQQMLVTGRKPELNLDVMHPDLYADGSEKDKRTEHRKWIVAKVYQNEPLISRNNSDPPTCTGPGVQDDTDADDTITLDN